MSIVGPRPETPNYVQFYAQDWAEVHKVKPGITGLASIKYSNKEYELLRLAEQPEQTYIQKILPRKLRYEKFYIRHQSFALDLYIMLLTIKYFIHKAAYIKLPLT
jgi:lipopolysaccharide/colanic/teichoic acid biosynthesis glycosyltransferase